MPKSKNILRRGFKAEANRTSVATRLNLGLKPYDKLCGFELSKQMGIFVYTLNDFNIEDSEMYKYTTWSAVTLPNKVGDRIIIHNHTHSIQRQQSNLMHELAHIIEGHEMRKTDKKLPFGLFRDFDVQQEAEADCLGGCLQLPREALIWSLKNGMTKYDISEYYEASIQMVTKRINETGVLKQISVS